MASGGSTVTQDNAPWGPSQPYIQSGMAAAQGLVNDGTGQQYFPTSTVVPFSNQTELGLQAMEGRAIQGSPLVDATTSAITGIMDGTAPSAQYWQDNLAGNYLESNPYLDATYDRMADRVQGSVDAAMGRAGRTNSGAHQDLMTDNLGDLANQVYGQNYQLERDRQHQAGSAYDQFTGRQLQAAAIAPTVNNLEYQDIDRLMQVGQHRESLGQSYMEDMINRHNFGQQAPWNVLNNYQNLALGLGSLGGTASTQQGGTGIAGRLGGAAGGALTGASIGSVVPGFGTAVGAAIGGLGGLLRG